MNNHSYENTNKKGNKGEQFIREALTRNGKGLYAMKRVGLDAQYKGIDFKVVNEYDGEILDFMGGQSKFYGDVKFDKRGSTIGIGGTPNVALELRSGESIVSYLKPHSEYTKQNTEESLIKMVRNYKRNYKKEGVSDETILNSITEVTVPGWVQKSEADIIWHVTYDHTFWNRLQELRKIDLLKDYPDDRRIHSFIGEIRNSSKLKITTNLMLSHDEFAELKCVYKTNNDEGLKEKWLK
jgi:hypothetical protein